MNYETLIKAQKFRKILYSKLESTLRLDVLA